MPIQHRYAFTTNAERGSRLRSFGNFQLVLAFQCGHLNFIPEGCLRKRDRDDTMQIIAFALKKGMLFHVQHYI